MFKKNSKVDKSSDKTAWAKSREHVKQIAGRDIQIEKYAFERKFRTLFLFVWWSCTWYIPIMLVSFILSGFVVSDTVIYYNGLGELLLFAFAGGICSGGLPRWLAGKFYIHPDSRIEKIEEEISGDDELILPTIMGDMETFVRGRKMTEGPSPKFASLAVASGTKAATSIRHYFSEFSPQRLKSMVFGDILPATMLAQCPFPYECENRGTFFIGSAGSGKTQAIKEFMYGPFKRGGRDRIVFYDRKPEYLTMFYKKGDIILCPADMRHTRWDLFAEISGEQDLDSIINSLIPDASRTEDAFWVGTSRSLFKAILVYLLEQQKEDYEAYLLLNEAGENAEDGVRTADGQAIIYPVGKDGYERRLLKDLSGHGASSYGNKDRVRRISKYPKPSNRELVMFMAATLSNAPKLWKLLESRDTSRFHASCIAGAEKSSSATVPNIIASLTSNTASFTRPEIAERGNFSIKEWMHDPSTEGSSIFLSNPAKYGNNYVSYFTLILNLALAEAISLPTDLDRRLWFVIDEFGSLQKLGAVVRLLAEGRSKGACVVLGTQDIAQIEQKYGKEHATIINNCNNQCIARVTDYKEAENLAKNFGEIEVEVESADDSISISKEVTFNMSEHKKAKERKTRPVVMPTEVNGLPDLTYYVRITDYMRFKEKIEYYPWSKHDITPAFIVKSDEYFDTARIIRNNPFAG